VTDAAKASALYVKGMAAVFVRTLASAGLSRPSQRAYGKALEAFLAHARIDGSPSKCYTFRLRIGDRRVPTPAEECKKAGAAGDRHQRT